MGNYKLIVGNPGPGEWTPPPEIQKKSKKEMKKTLMEILSKKLDLFWKNTYTSMSKIAVSYKNQIFKSFVQTLIEKNINPVLPNNPLDVKLFNIKRKLK